MFNLQTTDSLICPKPPQSFGIELLWWMSGLNANSMKQNSWNTPHLMLPCQDRLYPSIVINIRFPPHLFAFLWLFKIFKIILWYNLPVLVWYIDMLCETSTNSSEHVKMAGLSHTDNTRINTHILWPCFSACDRARPSNSVNQRPPVHCYYKTQVAALQKHFMTNRNKTQEGEDNLSSTTPHRSPDRCENSKQ